MPKQGFVAISKSDLNGNLKEGSIFIVARKSQTLPQFGIICPLVPEPTLPKGSPETAQVVNAKTPPPPNSFGLHTSDQFTKQRPPLLSSPSSPF
jgi:hypothetical protein